MSVARTWKGSPRRGALAVVSSAIMVSGGAWAANEGSQIEVAGPVPPPAVMQIRPVSPLAAARLPSAILVSRSRSTSRMCRYARCYS